jgi:hypothetical protein
MLIVPGSPWTVRRKEVETVQYDLGNVGLQILLGFSFGFGAIAQLIVGNRGTRWLWLIGAAGWFIGGLFASEVLVGTMTADEIQPIIDGLAFDEALLGGLIGGVAVVLVTWFATRQGRLQPPALA